MVKKQSGKPKIGIQTVVITFLLIATSLFLIGFLSYDNFEKRYLNLRSSAFETLANEIKGAIENGLALGLSCEELRTASSILTNAKDGAEEIHTIALLNRDGKTIVHVNSDENAGENSEYSITIDVEDGKRYYSDDSNNTVLITPLFNSFNVVEGYLTIEYSTLDINAIESLKKKTVFLILILLSIVLFPLVFIIRKLVAPVLHGIEMMENEFLSDKQIEGERNEIIYSAKQVMNQALNDFPTVERGSDE